MSSPSQAKPSRRRWLVAALALLALAAGIEIASSQASPAAGPALLTIGPGTVGPPVPPGFVGLSMEFRGLEAYAGQDPHAINPAFEQLVRNLAPGQSPVLRIGGDGTDWTWYPVAHVSRPPGVKYSLDRTWLQVTRALATGLGAHLIMGINLEANNRTVAAGEARAFLGGIGRASIAAFEIGNEPELYGSFNWYRTPSGVGVPGRPRGYAFADYLRDFSSFAAALPNRVPLAGPSTGGPKYEAQLGAYLAAQPRVRLATLHAYPLKHCRGSGPVTIAQLLSDAASAGLANGVAPYVRVARAHGVGVRLDELNGVSCGGQQGVSNAFASSLWALNALFAMEQAGIAGVNIHTVPRTINELIGTNQVNGHWQAQVHPEYYGLMMFAQAAPAGSRVLRSAWKGNAGTEAWATRATDGSTRVVLTNRSGAPQTVKVQIPPVSGAATLERLQAPSVHAKSGVTLGGMSFGAHTTTGLLSGGSQITSVTSTSGGYVVNLPAYSAALLTLR